MSLARIGSLLGGAALIWACNAPPIVVPPPVPPAVSFVSQLVTGDAGSQTTVWTASQPTPFSPAADARFFIFDENLGTGVIQTAAADGTFATSPTWAGTMDDRISVYFATPSDDYSDSLCLLLREGPSVACSP